MDAQFTQSHLETFGPSCLQCHDGVETYGKAFNHDKVDFALSGKHSTVACGDCHKGAQTIAILKAAPTACDACHQKDDKHSGAYGQGCGQCHNAGDWKQITFAQSMTAATFGKAFDHNQLAFTLQGKHLSTACSDCHTGPQTAVTLKAAPQDCYACH